MIRPASTAHGAAMAEEVASLVKVGALKNQRGDGAMLKTHAVAHHECFGKCVGNDGPQGERGRKPNLKTQGRSINRDA